MARWWAEFNRAEPRQLAYYRSAIQRFGEPVLDVGCGTGRFLVPLCNDGFDVDGADISADMLALASKRASHLARQPRLLVQAMHELAPDGRYRTMFVSESFGIGGRRDRDRLALRRMYQHLEPGGTLLIVHVMPYSDRASPEQWSEWLPHHRPALPRAWPAQGNRQACEDGDDLELFSRTTALDPVGQVEVLEVKIRLWHDGAIVAEESYELRNCIYFAQEIALMLDDAGFSDVLIEGDYSGQPATPDDDTVIFVARKAR